MIKEELKQEAKERADEYTNLRPFHIGYEEGYFDGAEPREKRILELEAEVKEWKDKADLWCKTANLKDHNIMINKELELENKLLKADLAFSAKTSNKNKQTVKEYQNLVDEYSAEGADLQDRIKELEKENAELKEELKKWKDEWQEQVQKATDEGYTRTLQTMQLTKAKELLKQWLQTSKASGCNNVNIVTDTEQFINEVEK